MQDLLFTQLGDDYPFRECVRVSWSDEVFEFRYLAGDSLISADRCREMKARDVLDAFLLQLAREA